MDKDKIIRQVTIMMSEDVYDSIQSMNPKESVAQICENLIGLGIKYVMMKQKETQKKEVIDVKAETDNSPVVDSGSIPPKIQVVSK